MINYLLPIVTYISALIAILRDYDRSSNKKKIIDWMGVLAFSVLTTLNVYNQYTDSTSAKGENRCVITSANLS